MITVKDIEKKIQYPNACKGRARPVARRRGGGRRADWEERVEALVRAGVDLIAVDTAHGHSKNVLDVIGQIRRRYPDLEISGGNVATAEGTTALIEAGVNVVKVGVGPGSICTTRDRLGRRRAADHRHWQLRQSGGAHNVPVIADGGIKYSGDITKALAAGAASVMIGSLFAGTEESPGETILYQGRTYKAYRGMGSIGAMGQGSRDRYGPGRCDGFNKLVPEGIEGPGALQGVPVVQHPSTRRRFARRHGLSRLQRMWRRCTARRSFMQITSAALREGHVHDVFITKEAPNYRVE